MSTLYEIDQSLLNLIDAETGEIADFEAFEQLSLQRDAKIENTALWYINLLSDAEQFKSEKEKFAERERAAKKRAEALKEYLDRALNGEKFKTTRVQVSYRTSSAVVVDDATRLSERFLRMREPEPDKTAIKEAIRLGEAVDGAHVEQTRSIQIK